ncbi:sce7725 family protein [Bacillus altitudinis]|uniref:sce7725 family protein n=1 Tax=Bacillus altitudinis TaxID=293387 RepID=UPI0024A961A6|nr:sce7725 family protein [Bacillus altitudinis]WHF26314.1 sce7725 family protein [Bacillus altitudinis]
MYFPFLRGKQHELFALRDLNESNVLSDGILPVIEPVKYSTQLVSTLKGLINHNRKVIMIMNPSIGTFVADLNDNEEIMDEILELMSHPNTIIGYHLNSSSALEELPQLVRKCGRNLKDTAIFHNDLRNVDLYEVIFGEYEAGFNFIPDKKPFKRRFVNNNGIILRDSFIKRSPNAEYLNHEVEWYSSDHLDFKSEGFLGFSDYSIVGEEYTESGFGAKAVAIHVIYPDEDNNFWVRHFVSDSNENRADQAGKFGEALYKFVDWYKKNKTTLIDTKGLNELLDCDKNGNYPGLGMLKRYSIKHHLELVGNTLVKV